jgi:hypothetical protein
MKNNLIVLVFTIIWVGACSANEQRATIPAERSSRSFQERLDAGAPCSELFEIRNQLDAKSPLIPSMNEGLRGIGCFSSSSIRIPPSELTKQGGFTMREYEIYRAVIDAPASMSESEAISAAAKKLHIEPSEVKLVADKVNIELFTNKWFGSRESEKRHASDWMP